MIEPPNRALLVGDVHATPEELDDCWRLIDHVIKIAVKNKIVRVVFMGDIYNTHNVMRVEVLAFWRAVFKKMAAAGLKVAVLVGNHDYAGEGLAIHALLAHEDQVLVVDQATDLFPGVLMLPYVSGRQEFVDLCNANPCETVLCHQTFEGSKYENGMYAPDGVDPNLLPQRAVISGHIHTPQSFDKVTYIGAPRWRTLADANVNRAIWIYDFNETGSVRYAAEFDLGKVCRQIKQADHTPNLPCLLEDLSDGSDWRVDIKGPADWIEAEKTKLQGLGIRVRTFCTDRAAPRVRESEGIGTAFEKFLDHYVPRHGTDKARLSELAKERLQ